MILLFIYSAKTLVFPSCQNMCEELLLVYKKLHVNVITQHVSVSVQWWYINEQDKIQHWTINQFLPQMQLWQDHQDMLTETH